MPKRTKIVCTLGPASEEPAILEKMLKKGMDVARLNFSHGTHEWHGRIIARIRELEVKLDRPVGIIADLMGPRIRVGELKEPMLLRNGQTVVLIPKSGIMKHESGVHNSTLRIPVTYENLVSDLKPEEPILVSDGLIELKVVQTRKDEVITEVIRGGTLTSGRGMNFPSSRLSIPSITEKDKQDLAFALEHDVDFIALSFVRSAEDIRQARKLIPPEVQIIAKIEMSEAVKNFEEILEAVDGVMVARGDLGIEMNPEDVPIIQKEIIEKCLQAAKPVIVATQMLESMMKNPRPTRAEVSDVANAVIDHTDAVMLSGESAQGLYPLDSVEMMAKIIKETESSRYDDVELKEQLKKLKTVDVAISSIANILARATDAKAILVASLSGYTARIVSRFRPELPIYVCTTNDRVLRQLTLSWAVYPFKVKKVKALEELIEISLASLKEKKLVKTKDKVIIIAGEPVGQPGNVNLVEIKEIE